MNLYLLFLFCGRTHESKARDKLYSRVGIQEYSYFSIAIPCLILIPSFLLVEEICSVLANSEMMTQQLKFFRI